MTTLDGFDETPKNPKLLAQDALVENRVLQRSLAERAEQLEAELRRVDDLLTAADTSEGDDELESEIVIPGAKRAAGIFPSNELLNPTSSFYKEASKRTQYMRNISPHPMKPKDVETLTNAVRQENDRLRAYKLSRVKSSERLEQPFDISNNVEGLDWSRIAEKVSDGSSSKRTAAECRVAWVGDHHPRINHSEWLSSEVDELHKIVSVYAKNKKKINWIDVAKSLETNRTPIDCMRHSLSTLRLNWTPEIDQKLVKAVQLYGIDNWQLVARNVSDHITATQCQNRWANSLDPNLKRGAWTKEEDERLRKAVIGFGKSWVQVATAIPGRTNNQCRERWTEHLNLSSTRIAWSPEEDKLLLDSVESIGHQWKVISFRIGNHKTGPNCRMRYDKLCRMHRNSHLSSPFIESSSPLPSNSAGTSTSELQVETREDSLAGETVMDTSTSTTAKPLRKASAVLEKNSFSKELLPPTPIVVFNGFLVGAECRNESEITAISKSTEIGPSKVLDKKKTNRSRPRPQLKSSDVQVNTSAVTTPLSTATTFTQITGNATPSRGKKRKIADVTETEPVSPLPKVTRVTRSAARRIAQEEQAHRGFQN